jgi:hypothetical protein
MTRSLNRSATAVSAKSEVRSATGAIWSQFWILEAEQPVPPDDKSGLHFCFTAPTRESVNAFHAAALRFGGRDNGSPGMRAAYGPDYYAAFVIDPDGYRIEAWGEGRS